MKILGQVGPKDAVCFFMSQFRLRSMGIRLAAPRYGSAASTTDFIGGDYPERVGVGVGVGAGAGAGPSWPWLTAGTMAWLKVNHGKTLKYMYISHFLSKKLTLLPLTCLLYTHYYL